MKNLIFRLFMLVIAAGMLFTYAFPWSNYGIDVPYSWKDYKLGLDLQWGIELDYKIDLEKAKLEEWYDNVKEKEIIEWLKSIIEKRVGTLNINDSSINDASYAGEKHIIVQIPMKWNDNLANKENIEKAKEAIGRVVMISFKELRKNITKEDLEKRVHIWNDLLAELKKSKYNFFVTANKYKDNFEKVEVWTVNDLWELNIEDKTLLENTWIVDKIIEWNNSIEDWSYILEINKIDDKLKINYVFIAKNPSKWMVAKTADWDFLNEKYFEKSAVSLNQAFQPQIELAFNNEWARIFGELSKRLVWKQMAIFVGGEMLTAPTINEAILSGRAVITWSYTRKEAAELSQNINTWVVPAPIYLTSEKAIDSKLWLNSLKKLIIAWVFWFLLIFIFLLVTYRTSWIMASIALLFYIIIILVIVKSFWTVLTLASIAWLILSIGMAIDANILIFERIREEIEIGRNIEDSTSIWFKKSWSAIWDSNVTWFIVAMILYVFWINMIKWFGLMLGIWIVVSLFSVMMISKVLVLLLAKSMKNKKQFIGMK